jgi:hypothetical protein
MEGIKTVSNPETPTLVLYRENLDEAGKQRPRKIHEYWWDKNVEGEILAALPEDLKQYIEGSKSTAMFTLFWPAGCFTLDYKDRV